jgi:hypothetical protein
MRESRATHSWHMGQRVPSGVSLSRSATAIDHITGHELARSALHGTIKNYFQAEQVLLLQRDKQHELIFGCSAVVPGGSPQQQNEAHSNPAASRAVPRKPCSR